MAGKYWSGQQAPSTTLYGQYHDADNSYAGASYDRNLSAGHVFPPSQNNHHFEEKKLAAPSFAAWAGVPAFANLDDIDAATTSAAADASLGEDARQHVSRVRLVTDTARSTLLSTIPEMVPRAVMFVLAEGLQRILGEVVAYLQNRQEGHLTSASEACETVLLQLGSVVAISPPGDAIAYAASMASYRDAMNSAVSSLSTRTVAVGAANDLLEEQLNTLSGQLDSTRERLDSTIAQFQSQFSEGQERRLQAFADTTKSLTDNAQAARTQYERELESRRLLLEQHDLEKEKALDLAIAALNVNYGDRAGTIIEEINIQKKSVEELVGVIGTAGITYGYKQTADSSRSAKRFWQFVTVATLVILIAVAIFYFLPLAVSAQTFSWQTFGARVLITLALGILGAYAAAQGEKAGNDERKNRRMALELEALGPFIAPLPLDMQNSFRLQVGDRSFGHDPDPAHSSAKKNSVTLLGNLLKEKDIRSLLVDLVKAARHES
jgi:hypothetical protein